MMKMSRRGLMKLVAAFSAGLATAKMNGIVSPEEARAVQEGGAKVSAFVIGLIKVKDNDKWGEYRSKVPQTLVPWGGEVLLRGRRVGALSGELSYPDSVVIRFPDAKSAAGWYHSPAYQAIIPIREQAADVVLVSYES
ncbi:MAG: DUF1330 domain-containing protein [Syntrophobacteraceae bacterium]|jgi:uncharacterized protein (DUF1330 family)